MKIRTDFVTNSSATCSAEVIIDNPVLLEILQTYKDMGTFGEGIFFGVGKCEYLGFDMDEEKFKWSTILAGLQKAQTPAFYYRENLHGDGWPRSIMNPHPKKLDDILTALISLMDSEKPQYDQDLYESLKKELGDKQEEIKTGFLYINWLETNNDIYESEPGDIRKKEFLYSPETGEKYEEEYYTDEDFHVNESEINDDDVWKK